jgi:hypothetical protein
MSPRRAPIRIERVGELLHVIVHRADEALCIQLSVIDLILLQRDVNDAASALLLNARAVDAGVPHARDTDGP